MQVSIYAAGVFVHIDGIAVNTASFGSGEPAIVFIPGSIAPWQIWQRSMELLAGRNRVVSFDHLGAGLTHAPRELVTFEGQVELTKKLVDQLELDRFVLVGDSSNVAVAVAVALDIPERIQALCLVAGGVKHDTEEGLARFARGLREDFEATLAWFVRFCLPEATTDDPLQLLADLIRVTGPERAATLVESYHGIDLSDRLAELSMPVVVVSGELDRTPGGTPAVVADMVSRIPTARHVVLDGIGHVPMLTAPNDVVDAIVSVLP